MKFKTDSGLIMEIDPEKWKLPKELYPKIIEEKKDSFLIQDDIGLVAEIHKSIVKDNSLTIKNNRIELSQSLYTHYFNSGFTERFNGIKMAFYKNFAAVVANMDLILSKPEYFLMRPDLLGCGVMYMGGFVPCLGSVFESWSQSDHLVLTDIKEAGRQHLISLRGSPMSGSYSATVWSYETKKVTFRNSSENAPTLPHKFMHWAKKFIALNQKYPIIIDADYRAINQLLVEIGVTEKTESSFENYG